jgi:chitinase
MKTKCLSWFLFLAINIIAKAQSPALVGYWHNWQTTAAPYISLDQVDTRYNVVCVSFGVPQAGTNAQIVFTPDQVTTATILTQIQTLQSQGRKVVLSIGGATAPVSMSNATERNAFINSVTGLLNTYGFDGIDIDFEGSSLSVSGGTIATPIDQPILNLIAGIKQIMTNYRASRSRKMFLSMAPETAFVQGGMSAYGGVWGAYLPVIHALRDSMELLQVQLYNSGSMYGINGGIYTQGTADFIVSQTEAVIRGFNTAGGAFAGLPASKVAIGLPACTSAAGGGYTAPATVTAAVNYLRGTGARPGNYTLAQAGGYPDLRGMMTWSINWDKVSTCGAAYEFAQNFQSIFNGVVSNTPPAISITLPTNNAAFIAPASVTINATATDADGTISKVEFYNGATLLNTDMASPYTFTWANVASGTYNLTAKAYDNLGAVTTSAVVTIVVNATNFSPVVSIPSPTPNAAFAMPASIPINANATDADGTITKVEFYSGTTLLNTDLTAPYSLKTIIKYYQRVSFRRNNPSWECYPPSIP